MPERQPAPADPTPEQCPTCGPMSTEAHPSRQGVVRCANCKEWLSNERCEGRTPSNCGNPHCPVHGEQIDPAELDAARLVGDMAEAEVVSLCARAESAETDAAAARAKVERVEALLDETDSKATEHHHLARLSTREVRAALGGAQ